MRHGKQEVIECELRKRPYLVRHEENSVVAVTKHAILVLDRRGRVVSSERNHPRWWVRDRFFRKRGQWFALFSKAKTIELRPLDCGDIPPQDIVDVFERPGDPRFWMVTKDCRIVSESPADVIDVPQKVSELEPPWNQGPHWIRFDQMSRDGKTLILRGSLSYRVDMEQKTLVIAPRSDWLCAEGDWKQKAKPPGTVIRRVREVGLDAQGRFVFAGHPNQLYAFSTGLTLSSRRREPDVRMWPLSTRTKPGRIRRAFVGEIEIVFDENGFLAFHDHGEKLPDLVIAVDFEAPSAWSSDGHWTGSPYYGSGHPITPSEAFDSLLSHYEGRLKDAMTPPS